MDALSFLMFVAAFAVPAYMEMRDRSARLERKLDLLITHAGIDVAAAVDQQVLALLKENKMSAAIKLYREHTGAGSAKAKRHVEALLMASMQQESVG